MTYDKVPAFKNVCLNDDNVSCWVNKSLLSYLSSPLMESQYEPVRQFSRIMLGYSRNSINTNTTADEFSFVVCDDNIGVIVSFSKNLAKTIKDMFIHSRNKAVVKLGYEIQKYFPPTIRAQDSNKCQRRSYPTCSIESLIQNDFQLDAHPRIWIEGANFALGTAVIKFNLSAMRNLIKVMTPCALKSRLEDLADVIDKNKSEIDESMADMCGEGIDDLFSLQSMLSQSPDHVIDLLSESSCN